MSLDRAWNAYIFRDGKTTLTGNTLVQGLTNELFTLGSNPGRMVLMDLLMRAGELECALSDSDSPQTPTAEAITNLIARSFVCGTPLNAAPLLQQASSISAPHAISIAVPEGFAYYSLHPLDFVDLARRVPMHSRYAAIIGIRSIGTTLSAIVQAALKQDRVHAERISVRPTGHPYDRQTSLTPSQQQWIAAMLSHHADFFVVDEGPGMSGSSFLSVGDALLSSGVPRSQIVFLCSRQPDPALLTAKDAARRWPAFNAHYTEPTRHLPSLAKRYIAGGIWRANAFASENDWPPSWTHLERLKFLSEEGTLVFRFEGFGRFGTAVHDRAKRVAEAGFGPMPLRREEGFGVYSVLRGRYLSPTDAHPIVLSRLAEYCSFRAANITSETTHTPDLETMLRFNTQEEFGIELADSLTELKIERPVIADGRMLPHKWIATGDTILKLDAATHGDDHFFPGPTDIAWDLAGAIIEWNLNTQTADVFVNEYRLQSGDDPTERLPAYLLAYAIFRMAFCKMASAAMHGTPDCDRFHRDFHRYREQSKTLLDQVLAELQDKAVA